MDPNGGFDPSTQGTQGAPVYATPQPQYQQAPMAGQDAAYGQLSVGAANASTPQVVVEQSSAQPMQDVRPGWQQDIQYSAPADPPWVQDPMATNYNQGVPASSGATGQAPISPDAYSLLLEPVPDMPIATGGGGKKPLAIVIGVLIVLMLVGGAAMLSYTSGYNKGLSEGKAQQQQVATKPKEENANKSDSDTADKYTLDFETTEPLYKTETISGILTEQLEASDGLVVMATSVDRNYSVPDLTAEEGSTLEFVRVNLLIGNADSKRDKLIKDETFTLVDTKGTVVGALRSDLAFEGQVKGDVTVASGSTEKISLLFEVTKDQPELTLLRKQTYKVSSETRTLELSITLTEEGSAQSTL